MPESKLFLFIAIEMMTLLFIVCLILLFKVRGLQRFIKALEDKIRALRDSLRSSRSEAKQALAKLAAKESEKPKSYQDHIEDQLEETRNHHLKLNPDRDIVLDIAGGVPVERQVASLRHAFLIAEQEAVLSANGESDWEVLEAKLSQLIAFLAEESGAAPEDDVPELDDGDADDALARLKKRVGNLERFKQLYFDMEKKWRAISAEAEEYQRQLMEAAQSLGADDDFQTLLERYGASVGEMGQVIRSGEKLVRAEGGVEGADRPNIGKIVIANQEEIQRLRNMAVDQHKVIVQLKKQLVNADSQEEKDQVIQELTKQLERQQRFIKEADTCTQLLEEELTRTIEDNQALREQLENQGSSPAPGADPAELEQLEALVGDLTNESRDMLGTIATLEEENRELKKQLKAGSAGGSISSDAELMSKLKLAQQELLNLQTQHIELEERYLELKSHQE